MKNKRWLSKAMLFLGCLMMQLAICGMESHAAGTLYDSPYVTFSPDGKAWTTREALPDGTVNGQPAFWYSNGYTISTGIPSRLNELREGQHYYEVKRYGEVPVGGWKVAHTYAQCIHGLEHYPDEHHGINFGRTICKRPYFSGWFPYCADCGGEISEYLHYMSKEAVASINSIDVSLGYYYLCPRCNHLEQGIDESFHACKAISYNRYKIEYKKNDSQYGAAYGNTDESFHMYNNETVFEGQTVTPNTHLTLNGYQMEGYHFLGWNTKPDGSGTFYADGAEILNLSTENYDEMAETGTVTLYAQWKKIETNLVIDPNGGSYDGKTEKTVLRQQYDTTYTLKTSTVVPPNGYEVSFETNGGASLPAQRSTFKFEKWSLQIPAGGFLDGDNYLFRGKMNDTDTIKAIYIHQPITLPTPVKTNSSFGGWYRNPECTELVGYGGDPFIPGGDTVLYAKWVELVLYARNNYAVNGGKGAVDLSWTQADGRNKMYQLYQSADGINFSRIYNAVEGTALHPVNESFACSGETKTITIPYTGFYSLTASGAQGGDYDTFKGGKGGTATGKFFLKKGEILTITVGGRNGFNGGGTASTYGNGGGYTIISSDKKGTLLIAGGGGGATSLGSGGDGGNLDDPVTTVPTSGKSGESGLAGGGGGHQGGVKGTVVVHSHKDSCYTSGAGSAPASFYTGGTITADWGCRSWSYDGQLSVHGFADYGKIETPKFAVQGGSTLSFYVYSDSWEWTYVSATVRGYTSDGTLVSILDNYDPEKSQNSTASTLTTEYCNKCDSGINTVTSDYSGIFTGTISRKEHHSAEDHGSCGPDYISGTFSVSIPSDVTSIDIILSGTYDSSTWGTLRLSNVRYSYSYLSCGRSDGDVETAYPSTGGTSYINKKYAVDYSYAPGAQEDDGRAVVTSLTVGFQDSQSLSGLSAPDLAAPDAVNVDSIEIVDSGENAVTVTWKKPTDNGTAYYHKAESYEAETEQPLCVSNITRNVLVSGVAGYFYKVDSQPTTQVNSGNGQRLYASSLLVQLIGSTQYLHLAAVDVAGNVSETVHMRLDNADVAWELFTDPLHISSVIDGKDYENIYPAPGERNWYVRADGSTAFLLSYDSYMQGLAGEKYQINYQILDSRVGGTGEQQRYVTKLPLTRPVTATDVLDGKKFIRKSEGDAILGAAMYAGGTRSNYARKVSFYQSFTLKPELHGKTITVTPVAGADFGEETVYSAWEKDSANALHIIADGEAPVITGLDIFQDREIIDRGSRTLNLCVSSSDNLSGIKEFYLKIFNEDNFGERIYEADESGLIQVDITAEDALFMGDFKVTAHAVDNVGNVSEQSCMVTEFELETSVERILEPHTPVFKRGESGILYITTRGYADRVEVEFPEELTALNPDLNKTVTYEARLFQQDECLRFMIPLYTPENENYRITVRAYKGDKRLEEYPSFSTVEVEGSVLDELRTRLR